MASYKKIEERRNNDWIVRLNRELKMKADDIITERRKRGLDNKDLEYKELFNACFRYDPLLDLLKKANIKKNEK